MPTVAEADDTLIPRQRRAVGTIVPIARWLPSYRWRRDLSADVLGGVAVAALLIPEAMGYAGVADVPPQVGLYAALGGVLAYAVFGATSILVVGPASAVAALSASIVGDLSGGADPVVVTSALAITSGLLLVLAGALRFGWIVNFISRPVLHAFVAGLSISIIIGQLGGLLGVEVEGESAVSKLVDTVSQISDWHSLTAVVGIGTLAALLLLERYAKRVPAAVVVVVIGVLLVVLFHVNERGVAVVGDIPQGLPDVGVPQLSVSQWLELLAGGTALVLVGFSEGYASASTVAGRTGAVVDADQELVGSGAANIASGLLGGLAVSGSLSKSSASMAAGSRTQLANLTSGLLVLATLLFLAPVFEKLPEPVLAGVVIVAVLRSANPRRVVDLWQVNRLDFAAGLTTFVLVLVWDTLPAMLVGVALSLVFVVRRASFPDVVRLSRDSHGTFRRTAGSGASLEQGRVAVVRFEAPLIYANCDRLHVAVRTLLLENDALARVVIDAEMISDLDYSGAETLEAIDDDLAGRNIELVLARAHGRARGQIGRSGLARRFEGRLASSVDEAATLPDVPDTPAPA